MTGAIDTYLTFLDQCSSEAQKLTALKLALKPSALSLTESVALSNWISDMNDQALPLLSSVAQIRSLYQNADDASKNNIQNEITSRIENLENKGIKPKELPELTPENMEGFLSFMVMHLSQNIAYSCDKIINSTIDAGIKSGMNEITNKTSNYLSQNIIHSDNKIIRSTIDMGAKTALNGIINNDANLIQNILIDSAGAAIGATKTPNYDTVKSAAIIAAKTFMKSKGDVYSTAIAATVGVTSKKANEYLSGTWASDIPATAMVGATELLKSGRADKALGKVAEKIVFDTGWKLMNGKILLKERDFQSFISSYLTAKKVSKKLAPVVTTAILQAINSYMLQCKENSIDLKEKEAQMSSSVSSIIEKSPLFHSNTTQIPQEDLSLKRKRENEELPKDWQSILELGSYQKKPYNITQFNSFSPIDYTPLPSAGSVQKTWLSHLESGEYIKHPYNITQTNSFLPIKHNFNNPLSYNSLLLAGSAPASMYPNDLSTVAGIVTILQGIKRWVTKPSKAPPTVPALKKGTKGPIRS